MDRLTVEYHRLWWGGTREAYMRIIGGIYEQGLMMKNASIYSVFKVLWRVWHLWHWHFDTKAIGVIFCYGVKVSKCQGVKVIFPWLLLCLYKHTNPLIQVSSIDFPSNLHRLCNGGSLEDHWCVYTVSIDTFKIDILLYYTPYLWIKHKNRQPSPFAPKTLCISMFQGKRWRLTDFNSYSENPTASDVILADFVELRY